MRGLVLVGYTGGHAVSNALQSFVDAAEHLRETPICLVLVGQGTDKEALQQRAQSKGLANVVMLPPVAKGAIPALLAKMDILSSSGGSANRSIGSGSARTSSWTT